MKGRERDIQVKVTLMRLYDSHLLKECLQLEVEVEGTKSIWDPRTGSSWWRDKDHLLAVSTTRRRGSFNSFATERHVSFIPSGKPFFCRRERKLLNPKHKRREIDMKSREDTILILGKSCLTLPWLFRLTSESLSLSPTSALQMQVLLSCPSLCLFSWLNQRLLLFFVHFVQCVSLVVSLDTCMMYLIHIDFLWFVWVVMKILPHLLCFHYESGEERKWRIKWRVKWRMKEEGDSQVVKVNKKEEEKGSVGQHNMDWPRKTRRRRQCLCLFVDQMRRKGNDTQRNSSFCFPLPDSLVRTCLILYTIFMVVLIENEEMSWREMTGGKRLQLPTLVLDCHANDRQARKEVLTLMLLLYFSSLLLLSSSYSSFLLPSSSLLPSVVLLFSSCNFFPHAIPLYRHLPSPPDSFMRFLLKLLSTEVLPSLLLCLPCSSSCSRRVCLLDPDGFKIPKNTSQVTWSEKELSSNDNCYC